MKKPTFTHDDNITFAKLYYKDITFIGKATCSPEDEEYMNNLTGETIALMRAELEYYRYVRDYEIIPKLEAVKEIYYSFNNSKNYSEHSYEARRVRKHMYMYEEDLKSIRGMIAAKQQEINDYFKEKDRVYSILRRNKRVD